MKLLYIFTFDYSLKVWKDAGILERELNYFSELQKNGVDLTLLTYGDESDEKFLGTHKFNIIPIYKYFKRPKNKVIRILKSLFFSKFIIENVKFDIIKQNQLQGSWVSILLKLATKKKLIIRTGYDVLLFSIKDKKKFYKKIIIYIMTQLSVLIADKYTVTSSDDKLFLEKRFFVPKHRIELRRNWVNTPMNNNNLSERNQNEILSVGRLESQKNFKHLIDMAKGTGKKIRIFGEGSEKVNLIELANQNHVSIEINNPVENNALVRIMSQHAFYITTSLFEGNPKSILEAMGAGCVVVAPKYENNTEIIDDHFNGYLYNIKTENPIELINSKTFEELEIVSINAFNTVTDAFSLNKFVENELSECTKLLK